MAPREFVDCRHRYRRVRRRVPAPVTRDLADVVPVIQRGYNRSLPETPTRWGNAPAIPRRVTPEGRGIPFRDVGSSNSPGRPWFCCRGAVSPASSEGGPEGGTVRAVSVWGGTGSNPARSRLPPHARFDSRFRGSPFEHSNEDTPSERSARFEPIRESSGPGTREWIRCQRVYYCMSPSVPIRKYPISSPTCQSSSSALRSS